MNPIDIAVLVILAAAAVGTFVLLFTGDIRFEPGDTALTIEASYWNDTAVAYTDVESLEYREGVGAGTRTWGFGSPRLQMGSFRNDVFGDYTRYAYTGCDTCVVMKVKGMTLVLSAEDEAATEALYEALLEKINA